MDNPISNNTSNNIKITNTPTEKNSPVQNNPGIELDKSIPDNWITYSGKQSGFSFKYPPELFLYIHKDIKDGLSLGLYQTKTDYDKVKSNYQKADGDWKESEQYLEIADKPTLFSISRLTLSESLDTWVKLNGRPEDFTDLTFLGLPAKISRNDNCFSDYNSGCVKQDIFYTIVASETNTTILDIKLIIAENIDQYSTTILSSISK
jgi:hypothetical protein